jgi:hypothetical protein
LRWIVPAMNAIAIAAIVIHPSTLGHFENVFPATMTATTASAMTAISGTYMRRSAPNSVTMGMMLDVGASVRKNHAPAKPTVGRFQSATTVAASSPLTTTPCGHTSPARSGDGQP